MSWEWEFATLRTIGTSNSRLIDTDLVFTQITINSLAYELGKEREIWQKWRHVPHATHLERTQWFLLIVLTIHTMRHVCSLYSLAYEFRKERELWMKWRHVHDATNLERTLYRTIIPCDIHLYLPILSSKHQIWSPNFLIARPSIVNHGCQLPSRSPTRNYVVGQIITQPSSITVSSTHSSKKKGSW